MSGPRRLWRCRLLFFPALGRSGQEAAGTRSPLTSPVWARPTCLRSDGLAMRGPQERPCVVAHPTGGPCAEDCTVPALGCEPASRARTGFIRDPSVHPPRIRSIGDALRTQNCSEFRAHEFNKKANTKSCNLHRAAYRRGPVLESHGIFRH